MGDAGAPSTSESSTAIFPRYKTLYPTRHYPPAHRAYVAHEVLKTLLTDLLLTTIPAEENLDPDQLQTLHTLALAAVDDALRTQDQMDGGFGAGSYAALLRPLLAQQVEPVLKIWAAQQKVVAQFAVSGCFGDKDDYGWHQMNLRQWSTFAQSVSVEVEMARDTLVRERVTVNSRATPARAEAEQLKLANAMFMRDLDMTLDGAICANAQVADGTTTSDQEGTFIAAEAGDMAGVPGIYSGEQTAKWKTITEAVHAKGGKFFSWGSARSGVGRRRPHGLAGQHHCCHCEGRGIDRPRECPCCCAQSPTRRGHYCIRGREPGNEATDGDSAHLTKDDIAAENTRLISELDAAASERVRLQIQLDAAVDELTRVKRERDDVANERILLKDERDAVSNERDRLENQRDSALGRANRAEAAERILREEKQNSIGEMMSLREIARAHNRVLAERDEATRKLAQEHSGALHQVAVVQNERDDALHQVTVFQDERDAALKHAYAAVGLRVGTAQCLDNAERVLEHFKALEKQRDDALELFKALEKQRDDAIEGVKALEKERDDALHQVTVVQNERAAALERAEAAHALRARRDQSIDDAEKVIKEGIEHFKALEKERDDALHQVTVVQNERDAARDSIEATYALRARLELSLNKAEKEIKEGIEHAKALEKERDDVLEHARTLESMYSAQLEKEVDGHLCTVCLSEERQWAPRVCGHFNLCGSCKDSLIRSSARVKCPTCCAVVANSAGFMRIFIP